MKIKEENDKTQSETALASHITPSTQANLVDEFSDSELTIFEGQNSRPSFLFSSFNSDSKW